jgi:tRNA(adenine34) deaminase
VEEFASPLILNGSRAADVARQIKRLRTTDLRTIEAAVTSKRQAWLRQHVPDPGSLSSVSPRQAYELLFGEYMGLSLSDLPVVTQSEHEITWVSNNACPTLEACNALGLDTRDVCRSAYEKPTQSFLSWFDPRLRFLRDYDVIRPRAPHCLERIVRVDFESFMRQAHDEAVQSRTEGNKGYGAVVTLGERVLARTHDTATTDGDPSRHAEFKAILQGVAVLGSADLCGTVLYSTCEPCPMCTGLAVWSNMTSIVYGASIADTAKMGRSRILISAHEIAKRAPTVLEVVGGVLKKECEALYLGKDEIQRPAKRPEAPTC